jgi:hypothetical protein
MSRPVQLLAFVGVVLAVAAAGAARGQPPAPAQPTEGDPLNGLRETAKAKFEATQRTAAERAKARAETARLELTARLQEYNAGKTTLDLLLPSSVHVLESRRAAAGKDADPTPFLEDAWALAVAAEKVTQGKFEAGKTTNADLAQVRWFRLRAEAAWVRSRAEHAASSPPAAPRFENRVEGDVEAGPELLDWLSDFDGVRELAKKEVEALQTPPAERTASEVKAVEECYRARVPEYNTGKTTLDLLQEAQQRLLETELAALDKDADPTPLLRLNAELAREVEAVTAAKLAAGKVTNADFLSCRCVRLEAEAALARALARRPKPDGPTPAAPERLRDFLPDPPTQARIAFEAAHADANELDAQRLEDARQVFQDRRQEYNAGKTTLELAIKASVSLLDAERAVHSGKEEQAPALERHWRQMLDLEWLTQAKLAAGKVTNADLAEVRYARQRAEAWWLDGDGK